ncbi:MAG: histidine--tRNA ligase [Candidatus Aenigmarchaeota archaeon]|nr:histidine--tRNA ligase [Candidatus Aenigmarchaeota archaeon]
MTQKFQPPKGTRDFMPEDMARREYIFNTIKAVFEKFGFRPLETPAFESWELLGAKGGGGEAIRDEVYVFRDKGGREMGLRFDLTVPTARVVASNPQLAWPFKRYQIGRVWRYDNPQAGRWREFWQADADVFGSGSMAAEAECIAAFAACLKELGFSDFEVRLNNRKVLSGMTEVSGISAAKSPAVFRALDKLEKQGEAVVRKELKEAGVTAKQADKLMTMIKLNGRPKEVLEKATKLLGGNAAARQGLKELEEICELSKSYGTAESIVINLGMVRGLDYYTGPIYEIVAKSKSSVGSIAGGGRYDRLVELYGGKPTPATGGSLGIERIYEIMLAEGMLKDIPPTKTRVFVAAAGESDPRLAKAVLETAQKLRKEGIPAETDLMGRKLKQNLDYANRLGITYVIVIGGKELASGRLTLKDMRSGEQKSMGIPQVMKAVSLQ